MRYMPALQAFPEGMATCEKEKRHSESAAVIDDIKGSRSARQKAKGKSMQTDNGESCDNAESLYA
jgi:hypothetical protein